MRSRWTLFGGIAGLVLLTAACSSGDDAATASPAASNTNVASPVATTNAAAATCPANSGLTGNINDHGAVAAAGTTMEVEAGDSFFSPTCVTALQPGIVTMVVSNTGAALHNVSIANQNIDMDVAPGELITVQIKLDGGAVPYVCKYHRTSGMVGSLIPAGT
ncbi:MAG: cupredoxin domain-containing protein [Chloroflexi bacterium]|nr:cupredoxin domain-containing protein [Chloroflexota bacterium]